MNLIFLTYSYENTNPTNICLWTIVKELVKGGHRCRIVSNFGTLFDSNKDSNLSLDVCTIQESSSYFFKMFIYILSYFTFPRLLCRNSDSLYNWAQKEIEASSPDFLIASYLSVEALDAGKKLKGVYGNRFLYVPYFLDGLLSGPSLRFMPERFHERIAIKEENKLLNCADSVVMMRASESKHKKYSEKLVFADKLTYLDLPLFLPHNIKKEVKRKHFPKGQLVIFYAGSMARNVRNPVFFLRLFNKLSASNIHLYLVGNTDYIRDIHNYTKNDSRIHYLGMMSHNDVIEMQEEADFLLNLGNHFAGMIPSKIFEYMSSGKPVISTFYINNDPCIPYFMNYPDSLLINEKENLTKELNKFRSFVFSSHDVVDMSSSQMDFFYKNTPIAFINHLIKLKLGKEVTE